MPSSSDSTVPLFNTSLYENLPCNDEICGSKATSKGRRYLNPNSGVYSDALKTYTSTSTTMATFLDFDEDGRLDFLLQKINPATGLLEISLIYNNYVTDTFFLKAMMTNKDSNYGDLTIGPSYRFVITDLNDENFVVTGTQLYQSSYSAL